MSFSRYEELYIFLYPTIPLRTGMRLSSHVRISRPHSSRPRLSHSHPVASRVVPLHASHCVPLRPLCPIVSSPLTSRVCGLCSLALPRSPKPPNRRFRVMRLFKILVAPGRHRQLTSMSTFLSQINMLGKALLSTVVRLHRT